MVSKILPNLMHLLKSSIFFFVNCVNIRATCLNSGVIKLLYMYIACLSYWQFTVDLHKSEFNNCLNSCFEYISVNTVRNVVSVQYADGIH